MALMMIPNLAAKTNCSRGRLKRYLTNKQLIPFGDTLKYESEYTGLLCRLIVLMIIKIGSKL